MPAKFLAYLMVLCFERRGPIQNTVARLKSNICPIKFWADYTLLSERIVTAYLKLHWSVTW